MAGWLSDWMDIFLFVYFISRFNDMQRSVAFISARNTVGVIPTASQPLVWQLYTPRLCLNHRFTKRYLPASKFSLVFQNCIGWPFCMIWTETWCGSESVSISFTSFFELVDPFSCNRLSSHTASFSVTIHMR